MSALESRQLEKAAMLFDVGKFVARVQGIDATDFAHVGSKFLMPYLSSGEDGKKILSCLTGKDNESKNIHDLLRKADTLASGTNSRKREGYGGKKLENIFNIFGEQGTRTFFDPSLMTGDAPILPTAEFSEENLSEAYEKLLSDFRACLEKVSLNECSANELLQILERCWSLIPAGNVEDELSDISLYDHAKLNAAYAICLQKYFGESLNLNEIVSLCDEEVFLLVSGDVSGIQQFIYTIPSKGALKSLRGRSFYLEILLEHIADEILTGAGVSRSCLLYTGGGHFYLLLPNTSEINELLENFSEKVNDWFLEHFDNRLYLAMAWTPCTELEFTGQTEAGTGAPFKRVSEALSKQKLCRYSESQLEVLFTPDSSINKTRDGYRECGICHTSANELSYYNDTDETLACQSCRSLFIFGSRMLKCDGFIVARKFFGDEINDALPLPGLKESFFLFPSTDAPRIPNNAVVRRYEKKRGDLNIGTIGIWLADYVTRRDNGDVVDFEELAAKSCGEETGIKRLAVIRADVDNLGAAFMAGFPHEYATLTRSASLSRQLAYFFKHVINFICAGSLEKFSLFGTEKKSPHNVHVVYSGGDDVFLVGSWDSLVELAVEIRKTFSTFTNGKLTFSAGIGFFQPKLPVAELARKTGELEETAKGNHGKDSVALFGAPTLIKSRSKEPEKPQCYSWKIFIENVCGEKLNYLLKNFNFDTLQSVANDSCLTMGKTGLYRILSFLADSDEERKSINLARFAYLLARLNPGETNKERLNTYGDVRDKFYFWYKCADDRKELCTALELVLYSLRDKGEK